MFKITFSKFPRKSINIKGNLCTNSDFNKFNLFKNNLNFKNFSVKGVSTSYKHNDGSDFFASNFKIESPPEKIQAPLLEGRFSRLWCLTEDSIHNLVMFMTHEMSIGIGMSTMILATLVRLVFYPLYKRNFKNMQINRLLWTDQTDHQERVQKLRKSGETQLVVIENEKWKKIQKEHGIKTNALTIALNLFQGLILVCWTGLVQRFSFNVEDYPEIMTGGFLWFKDLSMTDPYFLLPLFNSFIIMSINTHYSNVFMQKARRLLFVIPCFSVTIMCTLETGIVLYFLTQSTLMVLMNLYLNTAKMKKSMGLLEFLPGTKLERLNKLRLATDKIENFTATAIPKDDLKAEEKKEESKSTQSTQATQSTQKSQTAPSKKEKSPLNTPNTQNTISKKKKK